MRKLTLKPLQCSSDSAVQSIEDTRTRAHRQICDLICDPAAHSRPVNIAYCSMIVAPNKGTLSRSNSKAKPLTLPSVGGNLLTDMSLCVVTPSQLIERHEVAVSSAPEVVLIGFPRREKTAGH